MLVDEPSTRESLTRIVRRMTSDPLSHDDLLQEALMHLWLIENQRPGQTKGWYLQSCKFQLQHYLASGRSVDSRKRRNGQVRLSSTEDGHDGNLDIFGADNSFSGHVNAREIISLLSKQLNPREQAVLECLADGLGARDISRRL